MPLDSTNKNFIELPNPIPLPPETNQPPISFFYLVKCINEIKQSEFQSQTEIVRRFLRKQPLAHILPIVKLLLPTKDFKGIAIPEHQLIRLVKKYCQIQSSGVLYNEFKKINVKLRHDYMVEDIANVIALWWNELAITGHRLDNGGNKNRLSILELNKSLDKLKMNKNKKDHDIYSCFFELIESMNGLIELKFLIKLFLGKNILTEKVVWTAICPNLASKVWNVRMNLNDVIYGLASLSNVGFLTNTKQNINAIIDVRVGEPFKPMRCERIHEDYKILALQLSENDENLGFCVEEKLDGERSLMHFWRDGDDILIKTYSRNGIEQNWYGGYAGDYNGCISKFLKREWFDGINELILDGEMIVWDPTNNKSLTHAEVKSTAEETNKMIKEGVKNDDILLKAYNIFFAYDCVYYNKSLINKTLKERKNYLSKFKETISQCPVLKINEWNAGYDPDDIKYAMTNVVSKDLEGIVLKKWNSLYDAGKTSKDWLKLKPHHLAEFKETLDLMIMGRDSANNFICGLRKNDECLSFCLVHHGFNENIKKEIEQKTNDKWRPINQLGGNGDNILKFGRLLPIWWIYPQDSVVIKVIARNITKKNFENRFILDTCLRNPYCMCVRADKDWSSCDTVEKYLLLSNKNNLEKSQTIERQRKRKRDTKRKQKLQDVNAMIVKPEIKQSDLFKDFAFCIKTDCEVDGKLVSIKELNGIVESHGGLIIIKPEYIKQKKLIVIGEINTAVINAYKNNYNIFKFKWCNDCIRTKKLIQLDRSHIFTADEDTMELCDKNVDDFGCNDTIRYSEYELWKLVSNANQTLEGEIEEEAENAIYDAYVFYGLTFKIFTETGHEIQEKLLSIQIEMNGGEMCQYVSEASFIVVVDGMTNKDSVQSLRNELALMSQTRAIPRVVTPQYVEECVKEGAIVDAERFKVD